MEILSFFNKLSAREKIGLVIGGGLMIVSFIYSGIVVPINNRLQDIDRDISINEKALEVNLRTLSQRDDVKRVYDKTVLHIRHSGSDEEEASRLHGIIVDLANSASVDIVDTKPQPPNKKGIVDEYSYEAELEGDMASIIRFLYNINTSNQLLRAQKITLKPKRRNSDIVRATVTITKVLVPSE